VAYGQILKQSLLDLPPRGCINVHASLLPKYRGAAPIQWAIARGDAMTGVTIMHMVKRMDAGDIIMQESTTIRDDETGGELHDRLAAIGASLLVKAIDAIAEGRATRTPQIEAHASYVPKLTKEDGRIDWKSRAEEVYNRIRAFNPWPCCFCMVRGKGMLRILKASVETPSGASGEVLGVSGDGPLVATGAQSLRLLQVQPEGRKIMAGSAYLNGRAIKKGDVLL
jgi:methionyl-tRNA formyltransferase